MTDKDVLIVGGMRFSVVIKKALGSWASSRGLSLTEAKAIILDHNRLAKRFAIFEAVTLPFLTHETETDGDFKFDILIASEMPEKWKDRLQFLTRNLPTIHIHEVSPDSDQQVSGHFGNYISSILGDHHKTLCTFRLDDDDALSEGHVSRLRKYATVDNHNKVITHKNGLYLRYSNQLEIGEKEYISGAFGIAFVSPTDRASRKNIYSCGNHVKLTKKYEYVTIDDRFSWLRLLHDMADTAGKQDMVGWQSTDNFRHILAAQYPFLEMDKIEEALKL